MLFLYLFSYNNFTNQFQVYISIFMFIKKNINCLCVPFVYLARLLSLIEDGVMLPSTCTRKSFIKSFFILH